MSLIVVVLFRAACLFNFAAAGAWAADGRWLQAVTNVAVGLAVGAASLAAAKRMGDES